MAFATRRTTKYNETFFRGMGGPGPTAVGLAVILLIIFGLYIAFAKRLPFTDRGYEVKAAFANSANIRTTSPVRIAGVNVGEVTGVQRRGRTSLITFTVEDAGRPIHEDASASIRPRIFLEGNFFIDLHPGSPSAPELADDGTIPLVRTSTAVQLDELLTALDTPARENLQLLLEGFGTSLTYLPSPAADRGQDLDVQGESAAEALNDTFDYGAAAGRTTAQVNEAFLGIEDDDLSQLFEGLARTSRGLVTHEQQLQDLITNFSTFTGALAEESANLQETIQLLDPTLRTARRSLIDLNAALPPLRAFAIALEPGIEELPATIEAGRPWLRQAKPLLSRRELGGLASLLASSTPGLAGATRDTLRFLPELTLFSRCVDENLMPAGDVVLDDSFDGHDFTSGQPNSREFFYAATGVVGESANFDGNGIYVRFQPGGGPVDVSVNNPRGGFEAEKFYGNSVAEPLGVRPLVNGHPPPLRPGVPCHTNELPDLNGPAADVGPPAEKVMP
ncbi:MAG TPA: MlaD family protein [Solirubrobacterales bacterium]|nr:MlaD family protein [Solirubrobacterales bacterium]